MLKKILFYVFLFVIFILGIIDFSLSASSEVVETLGEVWHDKAGAIGVYKGGSNGIKDLLYNIGKKILFPIVIVIGLMIAFIGFYKLMFSDKEDERKKGQNFFIWGVVGIIIMVIAGYMTNVLIGGINTHDPVNIANYLYSAILHKLFILVMYIIIGILFVILLITLIKFMSKPESEEVNKNSKIIIIWNTIGIIIIIYARNIIEMFYKNTSNGSHAILENKNLGWLYTILNYALGFVAFLITIFIIYQSFMLLTKPEDDSTYKNLKRNFVYAIIGIIIIGGVYLITNFFIIK